MPHGVSAGPLSAAVSERLKVLDKPFTLRDVLDSVNDVPITGRQLLGFLGLTAILVWLPLIAMGGVVSALRGVADSILGEPAYSVATLQSVLAALVVFGFCIAAAMIARQVRPSLTFQVTVLAGLLVVVVGAIGANALSAVAFVAALILCAWLVGGAIVARMPGNMRALIVRAPISIALGLGLIGLYLFLLVELNRLTTSTITGSFVAIVIVTAIADRHNLGDQFLRVQAWRPTPPNYFETVVLAMIVGLASYAILAAFAPENMYDPFRQHLPIAREIWQSGAMPFIPTMGVTKDPIQGHLLFAIGWGYAGMIGAKLVNTAIGLVGISGVAGLGWLCGGRAAAVASTAIFSATTIVLWELGHTYTDMLAVMYTVTAVLCVAVWQRENRIAWLVLSGMLAGFGLASKLTVGWLIVAVAIGLFFVGNGPWSWRNRLSAIVAFACGAFVVVPWLIRSYLITGSMPAKLAILVNYITASLPGVPAIAPPPVDPGFVQLDLEGLAIGQAPLDLLRVPWVLTFSSGLYPNSTIGPGEIGILLLLALPLVFLAPRNRTTAFIAVTALISYFVWWLTPLQITRHLLPTLAIVAAVAGIGFAQTIASPSRFENLVGSVAKVAIVVGIVVAPLFFLRGSYSHVGGASQAPVDLITRRETPEQFILREIPAGAALLAADQHVPADAPLGYIGKWGGAQLYTEARLVNIGQFTQILIDKQFGTTPEEILANLNNLGIEYFVWDRPVTKPEDWRSVLLSTEFLSEHTRIVEGDRSAYLFEVTPDSGWEISNTDNLLTDPGFEKIRRDNSQWTVSGHALRDSGLVTLQDESTIGQDVAVTGGEPYMMTVTGSCARSYDEIQLRMIWHDAEGNVISTTREDVIPGKEPTTQFVWHRAPPNATTVTAEVAGIKENECSFSLAGMFTAT